MAHSKCQSKISGFRRRAFLAIFSRPKFRAFTIVELIVVIAILAILATVGFLALSGYTTQSQDAANRANVRTVYSAIMAESVKNGDSPRKYIVYQSGSALSGATFSGIILTGGTYGTPGTNYTAGSPDWNALRMDSSKFQIADAGNAIVQSAFAASNPFVAAADITETVGGKTRVRSFVQAAGISSTGKAYVEGNYPTSLSGSTNGLIDDPASTGALVDSVQSTAPSVPAPISCGTGTVANSAGTACQPALTQISAGANHACGLTASGGVKCWGYNIYGQVGTSTSQTTVMNPVDVPGLSSGVTKVVAHGDHTCAIQNGAAKCWGYNVYGQLGNGTTTDSSTPVQVTNLTSGVTDISIGYYHACAVQSGAVKCW
jgi:prepilin-type N-terminal cleavage/methylation domain-containing protein